MDGSISIEFAKTGNNLQVDVDYYDGKKWLEDTHQHSFNEAMKRYAESKNISDKELAIDIRKTKQTTAQ